MSKYLLAPIIDHISIAYCQSIFDLFLWQIAQLLPHVVAGDHNITLPIFINVEFRLFNCWHDKYYQFNENVCNTSS